MQRERFGGGDSHRAVDKHAQSGKPFLLRIDPQVLKALQRWANDDLRSLNAQIEFVLRDSLRRVGRLDDKKARKT